tara:strand:- start:25 stop:498 length:474 start_codon:yes stop_codon:yes gene_type:complete
MNTIIKAFSERPVEMWISFATSVATLGIGFLILFWLFFDGRNEIIRFKELFEHPYVVETGDEVYVTREFCSVDDETGVVRTLNGLTAPEQISFRNCFTITINFIIPELEPGRYVYYTFLRYRINPLKTIMVPVQPIHFHIRDETGQVPDIQRSVIQN